MLTSLDFSLPVFLEALENLASKSETPQKTSHLESITHKVEFH